MFVITLLTFASKRPMSTRVASFRALIHPKISTHFALHHLIITIQKEGLKVWGAHVNKLVVTTISSICNCRYYCNGEALGVCWIHRLLWMLMFLWIARQACSQRPYILFSLHASDWLQPTIFPVYTYWYRSLEFQLSMVEPTTVFSKRWADVTLIFWFLLLIIFTTDMTSPFKSSFAFQIRVPLRWYTLTWGFVSPAFLPLLHTHLAYPGYSLLAWCISPNFFSVSGMVLWECHERGLDYMAFSRRSIKPTFIVLHHIYPNPLIIHGVTPPRKLWAIRPGSS